MHTNAFIQGGTPPAQAEKAVILIHGRGGSPEDILGLAPHLKVGKAWALAPRAAGGSWYPYSFMAPTVQNQPHLDIALAAVETVVQEAVQAGFGYDQLFIVGFSQGACLTLEYAARNARLYGGIIAFTGGLIGASLNKEKYSGDFAGTPIHISAGDNDPHVPQSRINESVGILKSLHAAVHTEIYPGKPHGISEEEINAANRYIFGEAGK